MLPTIRFTRVGSMYNEWAHLLSWRHNRESNLVYKEVFRDLLENLLVKTTEHMLKDSLNFNLNAICNSQAATYFLRVFAEGCYLIIVHEIPIFDQCLIVLAKIALD
jgi:hypothetical protein